MRILCFIFCLGALAAAGDLPWMGVVLEDAPKEERIAVGLAERVGLKVSAITPGGPCAKALGEKGDLWWKFDGQILLSRSQMVVLLGAKKAGDEVSVEFYRNGQLQTMPLVLGKRPGEKMLLGMNREGHFHHARTLCTKRERVARLEENGVGFSLKREGENFRYTVRKGAEIEFDESFTEVNSADKVPDLWLKQFLVLKMTLDQHASKEAAPGQRRVRYVPRNQGSKE